MSALVLLVAGALFLAYSNGSNDNFKGVATLYGSGAAGYRGALYWATATTLSGSLVSLLLASRLVSVFSGKGLVPDEIAGSVPFLAAVSLAAALTVFLASISGFPISTTHALTGALVGAGWVAAAGQVDLGRLGQRFLLPLLISPLAAVALAGLIYPCMRYLRVRSGVTEEWCLCVGRSAPVPVPLATSRAVAMQALADWETSSGNRADCVRRYHGQFLGLGAQRMLDGAHYMSAGALSFARGLNDTPKIVALLVVVQALQIEIGLLLVSLAIAAGGLLSARRVAETVGRRITTMNSGQGFVANSVSSVLVIAASRLGFPVSTTHVACGALFGIGGVTGQADYRVIGRILLSWVITLPLAALFAALILALLH